MAKDETIRTLASIWDSLSTYQKLLMILLLGSLVAILTSAGYGFAHLLRANSQSASLTTTPDRMIAVEKQVEELSESVANLSAKIDALNSRSLSVGEATPSLKDAVPNSITAVGFRDAVVKLHNGRLPTMVSKKEREAFVNRFKNQKVVWEAYVATVHKNRYTDGRRNYLVSLSLLGPPEIQSGTVAMNVTLGPKNFGDSDPNDPSFFVFPAWTDPTSTDNMLIEGLIVGQKLKFSAVFSDSASLGLVHFTINELLD